MRGCYLLLALAGLLHVAQLEEQVAVTEASKPKIKRQRPPNNGDPNNINGYEYDDGYDAYEEEYEENENSRGTIFFIFFNFWRNVEEQKYSFDYLIYHFVKFTVL